MLQTAPDTFRPLKDLMLNKYWRYILAFYIDLDKIEQTETYVRYIYYNRPDNAGILELNFIAGNFTEIEVAPDDPNGYLLERAAMKISKHWKKGELPEKTFWAS